MTPEQRSGLFMAVLIAVAVLVLSLAYTYDRGWKAGFKDANDLHERFWPRQATAGTSR